MTTLFVSRPFSGEGANGSSTEPPRPVIPSDPVVAPVPVPAVLVPRCRQ